MSSLNRTALLDVIECPPYGTENGFQILADTEAFWVTVYALRFSVEEGDQLRSRAQVEITNDNDPGYETSIRGILHIFLNGHEVEGATQPRQNAIHSGNAHMPLWADASYSVPQGEASILVEARYRAEHSPEKNLRVWINSAYGHLVVEHYRTYPSSDAAIAAGAFLLHGSAKDVKARSNSFPGTTKPPNDKRGAKVYEVSLKAQQGDLVRLEGQSTSYWKKKPHDTKELHASGIFLDEERLSPWSTEDTPVTIPSVPLSTDAVHRPTRTEKINYAIWMHGTWNNGDNVSADGGHLYALLYRKAVHGFSLLSMAFRKLSEPIQIDANGGDRSILELRLPVTTSSRRLVRITGFVQVSPVDYSGGINCFVSPAISGSHQISAPWSQKYVTGLLQTLPLRVEWLLEDIPQDLSVVHV